MDFIETIFFCTLFYSIVGETLDLSQIENDFSPETFANLNTSKKYKKFELKDLEQLNRRSDFWWYKWWWYESHYYDLDLNFRTCVFMAVTYMTAIPDIRRYYKHRFLYVRNLEYEIGYMTNELVTKYQMMIEIYQIVHIKYFMLRGYKLSGWAMSTSLIFYMYRNVLELGMAIANLCNMMHELEKKYDDHRLGPWDDYPDEAVGEKKVRNRTDKAEEAVQDYMKRRQDEQKRKKRQRRKDRKNIDFNTKVSTPERRPKKSFWPLHYGWSIEFW